MGAKCNSICDASLKGPHKKVRPDGFSFPSISRRISSLVRKHADSIDFNCVCDYRRSIYPGYGHRNPGRAGMEDLPEGKVSDPVDEIDGMNCVWRKELAE